MTGHAVVIAGGGPTGLMLARHRRPVPRRGAGDADSGVRRDPVGHQRLPDRHNYGLALWQRDFERILAGWVGELAVPIHRECAVTGFTQDDTGVNVELSDGRSLRADYLVGCDGGRSLVRKAAGIEFPGWDATTSWLIAEVEMDEEPQLGMRPEGGGIGPVHRAEGGGPFRVVLTEQHVDHADALTTWFGPPCSGDTT